MTQLFSALMKVPGGHAHTDGTSNRSRSERFMCMSYEEISSEAGFVFLVVDFFFTSVPSEREEDNE